ncbi:MAG: hypothetical protein QXK49_00635 [Candidatus Aenigmatarchaeota archaeon]
MKEWLKGLILLIVGNILYNVIPVWITQYLLSLPNPFYSIGTFLQSIGNAYQSLSKANVDLFNTFESIKQYIGIAIIGYALYLIIKSFYKK